MDKLDTSPIDSNQKFLTKRQACIWHWRNLGHKVTICHIQSVYPATREPADPNLLPHTLRYVYIRPHQHRLGYIPAREIYVDIQFKSEIVWVTKYIFLYESIKKHALLGVSRVSQPRAIQGGVKVRIFGIMWDCIWLRRNEGVRERYLKC